MSEDPLANACVGKVFLSFMSVFRPTHRQFVKYKAESMALVQKLLDSNESFAALLERCGDDTHYGRMGLDARMQAPIQRVPRYILMLKDLRKYTTEEHPDYASVCESLTKMISTADSINEARRMVRQLSSPLWALSPFLSNTLYRQSVLSRCRPSTQPWWAIVRYGRWPGTAWLVLTMDR